MFIPWVKFSKLEIGEHFMYYGGKTFLMAPNGEEWVKTSKRKSDMNNAKKVGTNTTGIFLDCDLITKIQSK